RFQTTVSGVSGTELTIADALPSPADVGGGVGVLQSDVPSSSVISLDLTMDDGAVVCRLVQDYSNKPDVPLKLLDSYTTVADKAWRQQFRDACTDKAKGVDVCARDAARAMRDGIEPPDTQVEAPAGIDPDEVWAWNGPDRTLIEFEWTPCTPYLVGRGWDRWGFQHLNISTTGAGRASGLPVAPNSPLPGLENKKVGVGKQGSSDLGPDKLGRGDAETDKALQNICLRSATVRTSLRDRWANYVY